MLLIVFVGLLVDVGSYYSASQADQADKDRDQEGRPQRSSCFVYDGSQPTIQGVSQLWKGDSYAQCECQLLSLEPKGHHACLSSNQALTCQSEHHAADQNCRIAVSVTSNCDTQLKDSNACHQSNQADSYSQVINEETDEESGEYVGKGKDGVQQLKLSFADIEILLHIFLQGLRVVEGVLIAKHDHRDQEKHEEAYLSAAVWLVGALHIKLSLQCKQLAPLITQGILEILLFIYNLSINMLTNNDASRMSRIADHNIYLNTDTLYEPLRNALRKSTVSSNFLSPQQHIADNRLSASRIAKNARSLSPAETEMIKNSIFIPVNKELVPTRNLQKVMGKQFVTVDMEEKVGEAISPDEFSRVKTGTVEEIVYEIKQEEPYNSIYTHPRTNAHLPHMPYRPYPQYSPSIPQQFVPPPPHVYTSKVQPSPTSQSFNPQISFSPRTYEAITPQVARQTQINDNVLRQSSGLNKVPSRVFQSTALPTVTSRELIRDPLGHTSTRSLLENKQPSENSKTQSLNMKAYDFRQSTASRQQSTLRLRKQREEYKYNLFSLIDEGGNNGCKNGCFGSNQVCAPRISSNPWK